MITSIVTLYKPSVDCVIRLNNIADQVDRLIVCDNSPIDNSSNIRNDIIYCWEGKNLGLSGAFNKVLKDDRYNWSDDEYIIFFDQDSSIECGHITQLISDYNMCESIGVRVGCLAPVFFNTSRGQTEVPHEKKKLLPSIYEVKSNITSSMICKYKVLKEVDFWNDDVFLDMADWDLCWRMQEKNYKCLMTANASLTHTVGTGEKKLGPFHLRVGAPIREYYQIRDCLYLLREKYTPLKFRLRFIAMLTLRSIIHVTLYDERRKRACLIIRGVKDYKEGIRGELQDNH